MPYYECAQASCGFSGRLPHRRRAKSCLDCGSELRKVEPLQVLKQLRPRGVSHAPATPDVQVTQKGGATVITLDLTEITGRPTSLSLSASTPLPALGDLELSPTLKVRIHNVLEDAGITTTEELLSWTPQALMERWHFGKACLDDLVSALDQHGLKLAGSHTGRSGARLEQAHDPRQGSVSAKGGL